jgi:hypothetical protein
MENNMEINIDMMRASVTSRREKQNAKVGKLTLMSIIGSFLAQTDHQNEAVSSWFSPATAASNIATRFEKLIEELKVENLVGVFNTGTEVYLVKMVDDTVEDDDTNTDDDDDSGVEAFAADDTDTEVQ